MEFYYQTLGAVNRFLSRDLWVQRRFRNVQRNKMLYEPLKSFFRSLIVWQFKNIKGALLGSSLNVKPSSLCFWALLTFSPKNPLKKSVRIFRQQKIGSTRIDGKPWASTPMNGKPFSLLTMNRWWRRNKKRTIRRVSHRRGSLRGVSKLICIETNRKDFLRQTLIALFRMKTVLVHKQTTECNYVNFSNDISVDDLFVTRRHGTWWENVSFDTLEHFEACAGFERHNKLVGRWTLDADESQICLSFFYMRSVPREITSSFPQQHH